jgi:hypothetical protein
MDLEKKPAAPWFEVVALHFSVHYMTVPDSLERSGVGLFQIACRGGWRIIALILWCQKTSSLPEVINVPENIRKAKSAGTLLQVFCRAISL